MPSPEMELPFFDCCCFRHHVFERGSSTWLFHEQNWTNSIVPLLHRTFLATEVDFEFGNAVPNSLKALWLLLIVVQIFLLIIRLCAFLCCGGGSFCAANVVVVAVVGCWQSKHNCQQPSTAASTPHRTWMRCCDGIPGNCECWEQSCPDNTNGRQRINDCCS